MHVFTLGVDGDHFLRLHTEQLDHCLLPGQRRLGIKLLIEEVELHEAIPECRLHTDHGRHRRRRDRQSAGLHGRTASKARGRKSFPPVLPIESNRASAIERKRVLRIDHDPAPQAFIVGQTTRLPFDDRPCLAIAQPICALVSPLLRDRRQRFKDNVVAHARQRIGGHGRRHCIGTCAQTLRGSGRHGLPDIRPHARQQGQVHEQINSAGNGTQNTPSALFGAFTVDRLIDIQSCADQARAHHRQCQRPTQRRQIAEYRQKGIQIAEPDLLAKIAVIGQQGSGVRSHVMAGDITKIDERIARNRLGPAIDEAIGPMVVVIIAQQLSHIALECSPVRFPVTGRMQKTGAEGRPSPDGKELRLQPFVQLVVGIEAVERRLRTADIKDLTPALIDDTQDIPSLEAAQFQMKH